MPNPACAQCGYSADGLGGPICPECGSPWAQESPRPSTDVCVGFAAVFFVVAVVLAVVTWPTSDVHQWWAPRSLPLVLCGILLDGPVGCLVAGGVFAGLHAMPIMRGRTRMGAWLSVPVGTLVSLQWLWLFSGIEYGVRYQGSTYVTSCFVLQGVVTTVLVGIWFWAKRERAFVPCALFAAVSGLWLSSYAFPWLGESL